MNGHASALTLHMPAPWSSKDGYIGPQMQSSAGAANYYHGKFSGVLRTNTLAQIQKAIDQGAQCTHQNQIHGYSGMFARNLLVAKDAEALLAYTFGPGDVPADGGTLDTWNKCKAETKLHVSLPSLRQVIPPWESAGPDVGDGAF